MMTTYNETNLTVVMTNPNIDDLSCGSASANLSACRSSGLGIKLSTPILMLSTGLLGNILALVVLYTSKKEVKKTVFFVLLAGLAWTDLIGQLMTGPVAIVVYANNLKWVGGQPLCIYHAISMICFSMLTPLLVCAMSLERLLALRFTYFYSRNINKRKAKILIIGCWIFVLFFCTWPLMGLGSFELQFPGSWCYLNYHKESVKDVIYASIFASLNLIFIFINLIGNILVVITLLQMRNKRKTLNSPSVKRREGSTKSKSSNKSATETYMVLFLCSITLVFSTCYLPINVNILINQVTGRKNITMDLLGVRLGSINQILDPWLYILLRKAFLFKVLKHVKKWIWDKSREIVSKQKGYSKGSKDVEKGNTYSLEQVPSFQINVICDRIDGADSENGSNESLSSTSHLIPEVPPVTKEHKGRPKFLRSFSDSGRKDFVIEHDKRFNSADSDDSGVFHEFRTVDSFSQTENDNKCLSKSQNCADKNKSLKIPRRVSRLNSSPAIIPLPDLQRQSRV